jgi:hypothetical protein
MRPKGWARDVMPRFLRTGGLATCAVMLATGCGQKAATCENAIDSLIRIEFYGHGRNPSRDERKMIEEMLPGTKAKLVNWCMRRGFSAADLQCVIEAKRHAQWIECGEFNRGYGPPLPDHLPAP